jgi:hypothetical protein
VVDVAIVIGALAVVVAVAMAIIVDLVVVEH